MPTTWTVPGPTKDADLLEHGRTSVPEILTSESERQVEVLEAYAVMMGWAAAIDDHRVRQTFILKATGTFLDAHAKDRNQRRTADESDDALRQRLRQYPDAVTAPAILAAVQAILDSLQPGLGTISMVQLPRDGLFLLDTPSAAEDAAGFGFLSAPRTADQALTEGFGFRWDDTPPPHFILMLPSGTSTAAQAAIDATAELLKAAGVKHDVEVAP